MIKYNSNTINDWNFGDDNIIKVYRNNAVCYYKVNYSGDTPTFDVCYAVVDDITQYTDREFEDVYDKATEKWYKLNNLNQYEEYGVYGSGRSVTTYNGKLTIDGTQEYEWNGSSWVNVGEVSGSSRVPIGYTEVEYVENTSTAYINLGVNPYSANGNSFIVESTFSSFTQSSFAYLISSECTNSPYYGFILRWNGGNLKLEGASIGIDTTATNIPNVDGTSAITFHSDSTTTSNCNTPITLFCGMDGSYPWRYGKGKCYSFKLTINNNIVRDLVPIKRDGDDKYGMYDLVTNTFYLSPNNVDFSGGEPITPTEYPKYYTEKSEPLDNLTFNTMEDALDYAYNNCVYVGLKAAIDGDKYVFSGDSQSGYEWVYNPSKLPIGYTEVEYIENTSTAYINTNFKPNQDTRILLTAQCVTSTPYGRYIGAGSYDKTNAIQFDYETGANGTLHVSWGTVAGWTTYSSCVGDYDVHTYEWDGNVFYRDKGKQNQFSATTAYGTYQCTDNLGIFTSCQNGSGGGSSECFRGKVFDFKMYDNSTLVRDLVPCKRDSDNKYGMYDLVTNTFYLSPNNVDFNGGDLV